MSTCIWSYEWREVGHECVVEQSRSHEGTIKENQNRNVNEMQENEKMKQK